jgi:hypothetical protein
MSTFAVKINERSKAGKLLKDFLEFVSGKSGVKVIEEKSQYNPKFVEMIKKSETSKKRYRVDNVDELWESL